MNEIIKPRLKAEWEPVKAVLMAWPHEDTDWQPILEEAQATFANIAAAVSRFAKVILVGPDFSAWHKYAHLCKDGAVQLVEMPINDTWTRDYGAITAQLGDELIRYDYQFNGWGLKFASNFDNLVNSQLAARGILEGIYKNRLGFTLEGGSIECDGRGTLLTTDSCLLSPNRNGDLSREEVEEVLKKDFGLDHILWLHNGDLAGDDTDGHIDTLVRMAPDGNTLLYVAPWGEEDPNYAPLTAMLADLETLRKSDGSKYRLVALPSPAVMRDPEDDSLLPATYANYLIVNGAVIVPVYSDEEDKRALDIIGREHPGYEIVPVECSVLVRQHGSLHCSTMQL